MQQDDKIAEKVNREQRKWQRLDQDDRDKVVKGIMSTREGRLYVSWLLEITRSIGENPFTGHALSTVFACGEQNIGQQIMAHVMEIAPDEFLLMWKERANERTNRNSITRSIQNGPDDYGASEDGTYDGAG